MYGRQVFAILITLMGVQAAVAASPYWMSAFDHGASGSTVVASTHPWRDVNTKMTTLNKKVHSRMPASQKVELVRETLSEIDELRKVSPLQSIDKEIEMDYSTESLRHVVNDTSFSVSKCADYKARLLIDFEPTSENRPVNPTLKRSFSIIEGLCS